MLQCCLAQGIRQRRLVNCTGQQQGAHYGGDGHERSFVGTRPSPVGQLAGDKIDRFLDVTRGDPTHFGRLARRLKPVIEQAGALPIS